MTNVAYEWDPKKAADNLRKHGVDFADAVGVLQDPLAGTAPDEHPREIRLVTIGRDFRNRTVVVVYTWRGHAIRIISARLATPRERRAYEG